MVEVLEGRLLPDAAGQRFINALYGEFLGRAAEPTGLEYWSSLLASGQMPLHIVQEIESAPEHRAFLTNNAYRDLLGRPADPDGLHYVTSFLAAGLSSLGLEALLLGSPEYFARGGGTTSGFLTSLYRDTLGRAPDADGMAAWTGYLAIHPSRNEIASLFLHSHEAATREARSAYTELLHRDADTQGLNYFVSLLGGWVDLETIRADIASSNEYVTSFVDHRPPVLTIVNDPSGQTIHDNVTLTGQATDDVSGVASVEMQTDNGPFLPVSLDSSGAFQITTAFLLDGSADGPHVLGFRSTDNDGNVSAVRDVAFTLDTNLVNRAVTTDPGVQQMPSVAVDPLDAKHVVIAYMDYSLVTTGYAGIGVAVSHDRGTTWQHTSVPLPPGFDQGAANPILRFDDHGNLFVSFMSVTFLGEKPRITNPNLKDDNGNRERTFGFTSNNGIFVARSDDGGLTWNAPTAIVANHYDGVHPVTFEIIPEIAIDTFAKLPNGLPNPNHGMMYAVWARYYPAGQFPGEPDSTGGSDIMFSVSSDGGATWQLRTEDLGADLKQVSVIEDPLDLISNPDGTLARIGGVAPPGLGFNNQPHLSIGPEGDIYLSQFGGQDFVVLHSFDAGKTFDEPDHGTGKRIAFGLNFSSITNQGGLPTNNFRTTPVRAIVADLTRPGVVYAAEPIEVTGSTGDTLDPADVYFGVSSDYGVTWQPNLTFGAHVPHILNDDNSGKLASGLPDDVVSSQAMTRLAIDQDGTVAAIWYDTRRDPANHLLDVFGAISTDGGKTFGPNFRLTGVSFDANLGKFTDATGKDDYYLGDFMGLSLEDGFGYAAWTDTRAGNQDVVFTRFRLNPQPAPGNDRFENNDSVATATDLGTVITRSLPKLAIPVGDEDWFRIKSAATGSLTVIAEPDGAGHRVQVELWNSAGTVLLAHGNDIPQAGGFFTQQLVVAGVSGETYQIRVLPGPDAEGANPYTLQIQSVTADLGPVAHQVLSGTQAVGKESYYLVEAAAAGSFEITVGASGLHAEVLDRDTLAVLATSVPTGSAGEQASIAVKQGQRFVVHVFGDAGAQGAFSLELTNFDQFNTSENQTMFFPAGNGPSQEAVGDLNGDGNPDLVVTNTLSDSISVLLGNGDGTFQAPRSFTVGAFQNGNPATYAFQPAEARSIRLADLDRDGFLDVVVANYNSGDVSVLLGRGDGTFAPERRYSATAGPFSLAVAHMNTGDPVHDADHGLLDIIVMDSVAVSSTVVVLPGRGDGTFKPARVVNRGAAGQPFNSNAVVAADFNKDGITDLAIGNVQTYTVTIFLGNADGTFTPGATVAAGGDPDLQAIDLNGDGNLDLIGSIQESQYMIYALGNGDGTFQAPNELSGGQSPSAVTVADLGSLVTLPDGSEVLGPPDGHPDFIAAATGVPGAAISGPPMIYIRPGLVDAQGHFAGFGDLLPLAPAERPLDLATADFNRDGVADVAVQDRDGVHVIFGKRPAISANDTPQTARNLGTVVHVLEPALTIVPGHADAYYTLTVPTEAARGSGDEIIDFSGLFAALEGPGLSMEVTDASGRMLGGGERFRITAHQGEVLTLHVFGLNGTNGVRGSGAYTLDIDVLPQVVSVAALALLPGTGPNPGGPTASLVVTLQGDRLDPASAQDPANYVVTWLGPDNLPDTADDRVIPVDGGQAGGLSAIYDPSANVDVASGAIFPTAVRQTVTLLFQGALPAGSYRVELKPTVQAAQFNADEPSQLSAVPGFASHPVASSTGAVVNEGSQVLAANLVLASGSLGSFQSFAAGTPFLSQLHDDLSSLLDSQLVSVGDNAGVTDTVLHHVLDRLAPSLGPAGARPASLLVIVLDPVSFDVEGGGGAGSYDLTDGQVANSLPGTSIDVAGNVEVVVVANPVGNYDLTIADVPPAARAGAITLGLNGDTVTSLTDAVRAGQTTFTLNN
jgi:hypothetical protein